MGYSTYADFHHFSTLTIPPGKLWDFSGNNFPLALVKYHTRLVTLKDKLLTYFRGMSGTSGSGNTFPLPPGPFHTTCFTHLVCDWLPRWWNQPTIFWWSNVNGTSHPTFFHLEWNFGVPYITFTGHVTLWNKNCGKRQLVESWWKSGGNRWNYISTTPTIVWKLTFQHGRIFKYINTLLLWYKPLFNIIFIHFQTIPTWPSLVRN